MSLNYRFVLNFVLDKYHLVLNVIRVNCHFYVNKIIRKSLFRLNVILFELIVFRIKYLSFVYILSRIYLIYVTNFHHIFIFVGAKPE